MIDIFEKNSLRNVFYLNNCFTECAILQEKFLPQNALVLGCGMGEYVSGFINFCDISCTGFDCEQEINKCPDKVLRNYLTSTLALLDKSFDIVLLFNPLQKMDHESVERLFAVCDRVAIKNVILFVGKSDRSIEWWASVFGKYFKVLNYNFVEFRNGVIMGEVINYVKG